MSRLALTRTISLILAVWTLAACAAIGSLDSASRSLATFELAPLPPGEGTGTGSGRALFIGEPTAPSALSTDRILIKPNALQVAYLADGRWVDAAPVHVQSLLQRSIANSGRVGFVTSRSVGPLPDYALLIDLEAMQAELDPTLAPATRVRVALTLTIVRDADSRIVAVRRFEQRATAADSSAVAIVPAFDLAMTALLREATGWAATIVSGAPGA